MNKTSQKPCGVICAAIQTPFTYLTCTWYDKNMYRIFIIEDDDVIAGATADNLTNWRFEA